MTKKKESKHTGRKSRYEIDVAPNLEVIEYWCSSGLTDEDIAHNLDISLSSLYRYKKAYPEFNEVLKRSKEVADARVVNALYKTATGFYYNEETTSVTGEVVSIQKYSKPNTTAQIFWLKNRMSRDWRDKTEVKQDVTQTVLFSGEETLDD